MKIIKVANCQSCPHEGSCKAWKKLTRDQRIVLSIGNSTPATFILAGCHLDDDIEQE